jgi:hypothetical protein
MYAATCLSAELTSGGDDADMTEDDVKSWVIKCHLLGGAILVDDHLRVHLEPTADGEAPKSKYQSSLTATTSWRSATLRYPPHCIGRKPTGPSS